MYRNFVLLSLIALTALAWQTPARLSPGAALLFRNVKTSATVEEKNRLFKELDLQMATDGKSLSLGGYPVETYIYPTDMNGDGREELFVGLGSVQMFGNVGESFSLYMKDKAGMLKAQQDIGGGRPMIMSSKNAGYPDIVIGGPGFEHPLYRWNGSRYALLKKIKDGSLTEKNATDIEAYSQAYTARR